MTTGPARRERWLHSVAFQTGGVTAARLAGLVANGVFYVLAARQLPVSDFGRLVAVTSATLFLLAVVDSGLSTFVVRDLAQGGSSGSFASAIRIKAFFALLVGMACIAATLTDSSFGLRGAVLGVLLLSVPLHLLTDTFLAKVISDGRTITATVLQTTERVVTLLAFLVLPGSGALNFATAITAGAVVYAVGCWLVLPSTELKALLRTRRGIRANLRASFPFWITSLTSQIQNLDSVVVTAVAGPTAGALYAAPSRLTSPILTLASSFSLVLLPRTARAENRTDARLQAARLIYALAAVSAALLGLVAATADLIVPAVLGHRYNAAAPCLQLLCVGLLIATVNLPMSTVLQAQHAESKVAVVLGISALVGLPSAAVGAYLLGAIGGCLGVIVVQVVIFAGLVIIWRRMTNPEGVASRT